VLLAMLARNPRVVEGTLEKNLRSKRATGYRVEPITECDKYGPNAPWLESRRAVS
jgi:hypothetical protein